MHPHDITPFAQMYIDQAKLAEAFAEKERANGHWHPSGQPFDPRLPAHQHWTRCQVGYVIEELSEFYQEICSLQPSMDGSVWRGLDSYAYDRALEELSDALHFMLELSYFSGISAAQVEDEFEVSQAEALILPVLNRQIATRYLYVVQGLFYTVSKYLKNKPWKSTLRNVDTAAYQRDLRHAWVGLWDLFRMMGVNTPEEIYKLYSKKHDVNYQRIADAQKH